MREDHKLEAGRLADRDCGVSGFRRARDAGKTRRAAAVGSDSVRDPDQTPHPGRHPAPVCVQLLGAGRARDMDGAGRRAQFLPGPTRCVGAMCECLGLPAHLTLYSAARGAVGAAAADADS